MRPWVAYSTAFRTPQVRLLALLASLGALAFAVYSRLHLQSMAPCATDFSSMYQSALVLRHGTAPYGPLADWIRTFEPGKPISPFTSSSCLSGIVEYTYTPFFGVLMMPFTWLPYGTALVVWDVCEILFLGGATYAFLRAAGIRPGLLQLTLLTAAALLTSPLRFELYWAQADLSLLFLLCVALWARCSGHPVLGGIALGMACAIEPALLVVIVFLLWKRDFRFAVTTVGCALALILAPFVWLGGKALRDLVTIWNYYASTYAVTFTNDAPNGVLRRLLTPNAYLTPLRDAPGLATILWLVIALAVLVVALATIAPRPLTKDSRSLLDIGIISAAVLLISPWSENSQFTLLVMAFMAILVVVLRVGWHTRDERVLCALGLAALVLFYILGDPLQFRLAALMRPHSTAAYVYVLLAATYLYPLLAVSAALIYGHRLVAKPSLVADPSEAEQRGSSGARYADRGELSNLTGIRRVHIIGGPGSGKTVLGHRFAEYLNVPIYELDDIAGAGPGPGFRMHRPLGQRLAEVERVVRLPGWVTEGSFLWWTEGLLSAADLVVWLDVPTSTAVRRVIVRHLREYVEYILGQQGAKAKIVAMRHPHLVHLMSFVVYTWHYYRAAEDRKVSDGTSQDSGWLLSRAATARELDPFMSKVAYCMRATDAVLLLERLMAPVTA